MSGHRLTIGKVAARTGCHIETIRYYEKERLLPSPERSEGGHRLYTSSLIERLCSWFARAFPKVAASREICAAARAGSKPLGLRPGAYGGLGGTV